MRKLINHFFARGLFFCLGVVLISFYIFPIRPTVFPYVAELIFLAVVFYLAVSNRQKFFMMLGQRAVWPVLLVIPIIVAIGIVSIIYNRSDDLLVLKIMGNYFTAVVLGGAFVLVFVRIYGHEFLSHLLAAIVVSGFLVALAAIAEFLLPQAKSFFVSQFGASGNIDYEESFRAKGYVVSGGSALSFAIAICAGLSLILAARKNSLTYLLAAFVLAVSTLAIGRTGTVIALVFVIFFFVQQAYNGNIRSVASFLLILLLGFVLVRNFLSENSVEQMSIIYSYSLEFLKSYLETGELETASTTDTLSMYFWPEAEHWLTGAGFFRYPTFGYGLSDVGYVKAVFSFGIIGAMLLYVLFGSISFSTYRQLATSRDFIVVFFLIMSYWVAELKSPVFIQNAAARILILLFLAGAWSATSQKMRTAISFGAR